MSIQPLQGRTIHREPRIWIKCLGEGNQSILTIIGNSQGNCSEKKRIKNTTNLWSLHTQNVYWARPIQCYTCEHTLDNICRLTLIFRGSHLIEHRLLCCLCFGSTIIENGRGQYFSSDSLLDKLFCPAKFSHHWPAAASAAEESDIPPKQVYKHRRRQGERSSMKRSSCSSAEWVYVLSWCEGRLWTCA